MKNIMFFLLFSWTISLAQRGPNMFNSEEECRDAFSTGKYSYYKPKYFDHYRNNPVDGKRKIVSPATRDAIVRMLTVNGVKFVVLPKGAKLRWHVSSQGSLMNPYAYDACGNKISYFSYTREVKKIKEEEKSESESENSLSYLSNNVTPVSTSKKLDTNNDDSRYCADDGRKSFLAGSGVTFYPNYSNYNGYGYRNPSYFRRSSIQVRVGGSGVVTRTRKY